MSKDILIGIDAGTSVLKVVAFSMQGKQLASVSSPNTYKTSEGGAVTQSPNDTWKNCSKIISELCFKIPKLAERTAVIAVTGQGDGTWLVDALGEPVIDAWLWMDSRSSETAKGLSMSSLEEERFKLTGTGMFAGQQSSQMAYLQSFHPETLDKSATAFHCKDWLYMKLTGHRATDPSEACFTFGDFRTRQYNDKVIEAIGLLDRKALLPEIVDGSKITYPLSKEAASITGLLSGTPVSLAYLDAVCSFIGSGGFDPSKDVGSTILGTTGAHMKSSDVSKIKLDLRAKTGYVIVLPIPNLALQLQTNMSGTLNIDWLSSLAVDLFEEFNVKIETDDIISKIDEWINLTNPGKLLYHPYISDAGERGPFIDSQACSSLIGLKIGHRYPEIMRAVIEGLSMASRDCYLAMGKIPQEIRLAGGASQSKALRKIFASALKASVRTSHRNEPGATGAAMIGAMSIGLYDNWDECISEWVTPLLGNLETYDKNLSKVYDDLFKIYFDSRINLASIWPGLLRKN